MKAFIAEAGWLRLFCKVRQPHSFSWCFPKQNTYVDLWARHQRLLDDLGIWLYSVFFTQQKAFWVNVSAKWLQCMMNGEELGHLGDDTRLPRLPYLNITMKKIKVTHTEAAEETGASHGCLAAQAGLEKSGEVCETRLTTSRIWKLGISQ